MLSPTGQEECVIFDATWQECEIKRRVAVAVYAGLIQAHGMAYASEHACLALQAAKIFIKRLRTDDAPPPAN